MPFDPDAIMTQATQGGGAVQGQPTFPVVPTHQAPDNSGAMTNLSDADYAKLMAGQGGPTNSTPAAPPPKPSFDPDALMTQAAQGKTSAPQTTPTQVPPKTPSWADIPANMVGSLASTINGIPRGLLGGQTVDAIDAATQTPIRMLTGWQGPLSAFNEGMQAARQRNSELSNAYPYANMGGEVAGGMLGGAMMAPSLGWSTAAGLLPKVGAAADYIGRNASFGGLMSALNGGSPLAGAGIGAALPFLHVAGSTASAPFQWAARQLPQILSPSAQETAVGNTLAQRVGGSPIQTSPVGPLSLTQATNNPTVAAYGDIAPGFNAGANANLLSGQQNAIADQIAKIGPQATGPDAAAAFTQALREGRGISGSEENRLWTVPELAQTTISPDTIQQSVGNALGNMDPVLRDSMSPRLQALVNRVNNAQPTTVQDLNGIRSDFEQVARTSNDGGERNIARTLSSAFMDGMGQTPEIVNNPQIAGAWSTARDFTRRMRTLFGEGDIAPLLSKNAAGVYRAQPSEAFQGGRFFNFSFGSGEGPRTIAELSDFVRTLRSQSGSGAVADRLKASARSYVASALTDASRANEGQNFNTKTMQDFLRRNGDWMRTSGLFSGSQIQAANELMDYASMLRRPEQLLRQVNSATQPRSARSQTFIHEIMNPWARRLVELSGIGLGGEHAGGIGAMIGGAVGGAFEMAVHRAESSMQTLMAQALLDPSVAQGLMMKASAANRVLLSPQTRQLIDTLRAGVGSAAAGVIPQLNAPPLAAPAPTGAQQ